MYYECRNGPYTISTDPALLDLDAMYAVLSHAYWAIGRPKEVLARAVRHSLCFGVYHGSAQVGLTRVITDYAVFAYLCDVYIHPDHRGHGLGKWMIGAVRAHPDLQGLRRWLLVTRDAHGLYRQYDFVPVARPQDWMEILRPYAPEPSRDTE